MTDKKLVLWAGYIMVFYTSQELVELGLQLRCIQLQNPRKCHAHALPVTASLTFEVTLAAWVFWVELAEVLEVSMVRELEGHCLRTDLPPLAFHCPPRLTRSNLRLSNFLHMLANPIVLGRDQGWQFCQALRWCWCCCSAQNTLSSKSKKFATW